MRLHPSGIAAAALAALAIAAMGIPAHARAADAAVAPVTPAAAVPAVTPTAVRGTLAASATWGGVVHVEAAVEVPAGVTLTLLPGTELRFPPGSALNVAGVLSAEGTAERPISFVPADPAQPGDWGQLHFNGLPGGSLLRHCRVQRADALVVLAGAVTLEDCEITGGRAGVAASTKGAELRVLRTRFADLREGGASYSVNAAGTVAASTFERCGPHGVSVATGAVCEVRENRVIACETGIEVVRTEPLVFGNTVRGCNRGIALTYAGGGRPVERNTLEDNATGIYCQQFSAPEIRGNTVTGGGEGIFCFMGATPLIAGNTVRRANVGIYCTQMSNPSIEANRIEDNATGILLNLSSYPVLRGNSILGNGVQMKLDTMSLDWERRAGGKPSRGRQQQRLGRESRGKAAPGGEPTDGFDAGAGLVDARENWWGDAVTREMEQKGGDANIAALVDGYDTPVQTYEGYAGEFLQDKITYAPWLKQPSAGAPPAAAPEGGLEGRVTVGGESVAGGAVFAYRTFEDVLAAKPFASSGPTDDDGAYALALPPGRYFVVARKRAAGVADGPLETGDGHSFYGHNPVTVDAGRRARLGFSLARKLDPVRYRDGGDPATGSLEGVVEHRGQPLAGAGVQIFLDGADLFRGPGYATAAPTGADGTFRIDQLPESAFFVVVRKRAKGAAAGPIAEGDFFGYFVDNPVQVHAGRIATIRVEAISKAGSGSVESDAARATGTVITGRIVGKDGAVVPGVYAFAYQDKTMGLARPVAISREVGKDGSYAITLPAGGVYFVGARSAYGDSPALGEWYGRYDVTPDHSVRVETDARAEGVDIVVERINP